MFGLSAMWFLHASKRARKTAWQRRDKKKNLSILYNQNGSVGFYISAQVKFSLKLQ